MIDNQWQTVYTNEYGSDIYENKIYHPFYELEDDVLDIFESWITNTVPTLLEGHIPTVYCHYENHYQYDPKLNNGKHLKEIYRCSPCYRNQEWFDWINVIYEDRHDETRKYNVAARIFLWVNLHYEDNKVNDSIFLLAKPLKEWPTPNYELLDCLRCDKMFETAEIYDINKVSEIAAVSVFPAVKFDSKNGNHNKEELHHY